MYIFRGIHRDRGLICFCKKNRKKLFKTHQKVIQLKLRIHKLLRLKRLFTLSAAYLKLL